MRLRCAAVRGMSECGWLSSVTRPDLIAELMVASTVLVVLRSVMSATNEAATYD